MGQAKALVATLKRTLRTSRMTYRDVAERLGMSEANVKRLFASGRFSLDRLEQVCELLGLELSDLLRIHDESRRKITQLTVEQEEELMSDTKLLFVAVCVRNRLSFEDITQHYRISQTDCIRCLAKLDKLQIIDLLPGNRIRLRIDDDFRWLPKGPIERFFEKQILSQFLKASFNSDGQLRLFLSGLLSDRSHEVILRKLQALAAEFAELHRLDAELPLASRNNVGLLIALRPWELEVFRPLLKAGAASHGA